MYGFDSELQFDSFLGCELTQIAFGLHDLILNFSAGLQPGKTDFAISIQSAISTGSRWLLLSKKGDDFRLHAGPLFRCLGQSVVSLNVKNKHTLLIEFDNGNIITVYDDSDQFDSVVITQGSTTIVI